MNTLNHPVASAEQWLAQRKALLAREKELTHLKDQVARERRALPWVRIDKHYVFDTPSGPRTLAELFLTPLERKSHRSGILVKCRVIPTYDILTGASRPPRKVVASLPIKWH